MKWDRHLDFGVAQQTPQKVQFFSTGYDFEKGRFVGLYERFQEYE